VIQLNQYSESGTEKIQLLAERVQLGTKFSTLNYANKLAVVNGKQLLHILQQSATSYNRELELATGSPTFRILSNQSRSD
jgi:hypothetical protein